MSHKHTKQPYTGNRVFMTGIRWLSVLYHYLEYDRTFIENAFIKQFNLWTTFWNEYRQPQKNII